MLEAKGKKGGKTAVFGSISEAMLKHFTLFYIIES